ncbi:hypothetical protein UlMin_005139 [Ulmus minor]
MEKLEKKLSFQHFSHEHPLKYTKNSSPSNENISCSACKLEILSGRDYYCCKICPFFLHKVCYDMPRKTHHLAHPNHFLTLQSSPSSATGKFLCKACGDHVNGFHYSCSECSFSYHILCSALPLSVLVSSHSHSLKLTFSPPYNFSCDICTKPSYNGWLYRCQICEFDTHLFCAISNQKNPSTQNPTTQIPNTSTKQSLNSEVDELMQLIMQSVGQDLIISNAVTGWDHRLYSPIENPNMKSTHLGSVAFHQTGGGQGSTSSNQGRHFLELSPLTPLSEDTCTVPSYQFSDACFSIDLAKSYSNFANQSRSEEAIYHQDTKGVLDVQRAMRMNELNQDQKQLNYAYGSSRVYSYNMGQEERINEAFLARTGSSLPVQELGLNGKKSKENEGKDKLSIRNQTNKPQEIIWYKPIICIIFP